MGARRTARQLALKVLYTVNLLDISRDVAWDIIYNKNNKPKQSVSSTEALAEGVYNKNNKIKQSVSNTEALAEGVYNGEYPPAVIDFAKDLVDGTLKNLEVIDGLILKYAKNWEMSRIAPVDKTIIRMGLYEILYEDSIPPNVSINEAVELAKRFSTSKSHKFVNGILDAAKENVKIKSQNAK